MRFLPHLTLSLLLAASLARAQEVNQNQNSAAPAERENPTPGTVNSTNIGDPTFTTQLFSGSRTTLLGDMFGLRSFAGNYGISIGLTETSEMFGNITGGVRQGADYDGLTLMSLGLDTQRAFSWRGGTFNISALQIHGRDLSTDDLDNLNTNSGIQANRATRLWEAWFQQTFADGMADIKVGQQSLDQEFIGSTYAGTFINTMMGWPIIPSYDQYAGGPAYPLSSLGARLRVRPTGALTLLGGVFDDNPSGGPFDNDSQVRGAEQSGTKFSLNTGALVFAEMQYVVNQPSEGQMAGPVTGLPGTYRFGGWFDSGSFPDQDEDASGLSLASPEATGSARLRRHDFSLYGVADQMVWQPDPEGPRSLGVFTRIMGAPDDRNLISFGLNAGFVLKAPLPGRDSDSFGLGYGLAKVSDDAILFDRQTAVISDGYSPIRSSESFIEITYQYQIAPWWQVQPDFQYVFLPGGGIANPDAPGQRVGNEAVLGVRTNITF
jgi:porin